MLAIPLAYNLRNLMARKVSTTLTVAGIALAVGIFLVVLMLVNGLQHAMAQSGSSDNAVILRKGATSETLSGIDRAGADVIEVSPEIAIDAGGEPMVAAEAVVGVALPRRNDPTGRGTANVTLRGIVPMSLPLRDKLRIVEGRAPESGKPEILAGVSAASGFKGCEVGGTIQMGGISWSVVGLFEAGGSSFESELWGDRELLGNSFGRNGFSSVTLRMRDPRLDVAALQARFDADPRLNVHVQTESDYFSSSSEGLRVLISMLGGVLIVLFSMGAVMGAMVTMFAFVGSRTREIGTLRALGFSRRSIATCFMVESLMLALAGGIVAAIPALLVQRLTFSTTNWATFTDVTWHFRASPTIIVSGLLFSLVMGWIGGMIPATRAALLPITTSLREA
jgi:ABC-type antimicrobial peptide transport system permease subunit